MDSLQNPFAPGAGNRPPELAGREAIIQSVQVSCERALNGLHGRSMMLLGLQGTGKTAILSELAITMEKSDVTVTQLEASEGADLAKMIGIELRKVMRSLSNYELARHIAVKGLRGLRNFASILKLNIGGIGIGIEGASDPEPGFADTGEIQFDLPDLFEAIGQAAQAAGQSWLLLIDEMQYLNATDLSALIMSMHRASKKGLPIVLVSAGLPQTAKLAGDAKSYSERLFRYTEVGALDADSSKQAIVKPIEKAGASIHPEAARAIANQTRGYPFFIQEWASSAWEISIGPMITLPEVNEAYLEALAALDEGFFKLRKDRLTKAELRFVSAMAEIGDGPYAFAKIADAMGKKVSSLGPARAGIIKKGMIYSINHGYLDFTVPLFADFIRRTGISQNLGDYLR